MAIEKIIKDSIRSIFPLDLRKNMAKWISCQKWLPRRNDWSIGMIRDLQMSDPKGFHNFVWKNHFYHYAKNYNSENLFYYENFEPSRIEFFKMFLSALYLRGIDVADIRSVLEVGCSLGYLLYFIEKNLLFNVDKIVGIDIDEEAISKGSQILVEHGSKINLINGGMEDLSLLVEDNKFDFIFAAGVLSYIDESSATKVVSEMLARTNKILGVASLAHTLVDNSNLEASQLDPNRKNQWVHNIDLMINRAGGSIITRRWEGGREFNEQTIYFVFASPPLNSGL